LKNPVWGLVLPPNDFLDCDELLRERTRDIEAEERYGEICTAYVALTRAKSALHVVTTRLKESTTSTNFARWLYLALGEQSYDSGDPKWFTECPFLAPESPSLTETHESKFHPPLRGTPRPETPSSSKLDSPASGEATSSGDGMDAAELGTEIHAALAKLEWMGLESPTFADLSQEARNLLVAFFNRAEAREVFSKPASPCRLWREQAFDVSLDGAWFSGVFDRVVVNLDPDGQPASATIFDFKTDQASQADIDLRYASQMDCYRRALCAITKLPLEAVQTRLIRVR
jgi:ATP-dependent exoDNAse (exonuclease V) beta subunit